MIHAQHIGPIEAQIRAAAEARRQRLFPPQTRPQARVSDKPAVRLVEKVEASQPAHGPETMRSPTSFLKARCREIGVDYREIVGPSRVDRLVHVRHQLMVEVKTAFPKQSMPYIGKMFGRDHTVVLYAFEKMGIPSPKPITLRGRAVEIKAMLDQGKTYADIGRALDYSFSAIQMFAVKRGWTKANHRTRFISDHAETVERMWREGAKTEVIAEAIDFEPTSVSRYIRKQGWTRP